MYNSDLKLKIGRSTENIEKKAFWGQFWVSVISTFCDFEVSVMLQFSKILGHLPLIVQSGLIWLTPFLYHAGTVPSPSLNANLLGKSTPPNTSFLPTKKLAYLYIIALSISLRKSVLKVIFLLNFFLWVGRPKEDSKKRYEFLLGQKLKELEHFEISKIPIIFAEVEGVQFVVVCRKSWSYFKIFSKMSGV